MKTKSLAQVSARVTWTQVIIAVAGLWYLLAGLVQLLAPQWFFDNIGYFPPFNRHYVGDLGAFILPLGIGLLVAARNPPAHHLLVGVAAAGSFLHLLNHLYDDLGTPSTLAHLVFDTLPLFVLAMLLIVEWWSTPTSKRESNHERTN